MIKRLVLCLSALLLLKSCGQDASFRWQEKYDLGMKYLEEENYEEAISAFTEAIEIDSSRAKAYEARGGAYILSDETEGHLSSAQADYERTMELGETSLQTYPL